MTALANSTVDYADYAHTGPGTLAGRFLRRFWQPVWLASDLPAGHARPLRVMSEDYTLFRGESGTPYLTEFRCAHRGTQLSTGWVEGDRLRCFYHGWTYDGSGQCVEMPAEDSSFPPKVRLRAYPVQEYLGLIWAYLGEGEPPPFQRWPEFEEPGVLQPTRYTRDCNYFNNVENQCDEVHVAFAHRISAFSDAGLNPFDVPRVAAEETEYGMAQYATRTDGIARITHFLMPNGIFIKGSPDDGSGGWVDYVAWRVLVDDTYHHSYNLTLAHVTGEAAEQYRARQAERRAQAAERPDVNDLAARVLRGELHTDELKGSPDIVMVQDTVAQCGQGVIADRTRERLGKSDVAIYLLRKMWSRELRALAEGKPLKAWRHTQWLRAASGVAGS